MTYTLAQQPTDASYPDATTGQTRCLTASLFISTVGVTTSILGWWLVRHNNLEAAREGRRMKDFLSVDWDSSGLPLLLFIMFVAGAAAFILACLGAAAARSTPQKAVVAGALAASLVMVPIVVVANTWVTASVTDPVGGD